MKELQKKLDLTLSKAGQYNRYQIIIVILFSLQFMCSQFFHNNFTYLITRPFIIYKNNKYFLLFWNYNRFCYFLSFL